MTAYFDHFADITSGRLRLVDLRSPCEFNLGAMPLAVNVPLFTDDERAIVGTTYKQVGKTEAVQAGLEYVANKMPALLDELLSLAGPEKKLALHCFRGGMRSGSVAKLMEYVGITPVLLTGGYKAYRNQVLGLLDEFARHPILVLNGRTGSGKSALIRDLKAHGAPVIDFEGLACHRGSAVGDFNIDQPQPTQQNFENQLANEFVANKGSGRIIVEIEQDIGDIRMPRNLREHIHTSQMILIERSMDDRVKHLMSEYTTTWGEHEDKLFSERMLLLKKHIQGPVFNQILAHVEKREFSDAITLFLRHRYDACYDKGIKKVEKLIIDSINVSENWDDARQRIFELR